MLNKSRCYSSCNTVIAADLTDFNFHADSHTNRFSPLAKSVCTNCYIYTDLFTLANYYIPWNRQKTMVYLMVSEETEDNQFIWIHLILEIEFDDNCYWVFTDLF